MRAFLCFWCWAAGVVAGVVAGAAPTLQRLPDGSYPPECSRQGAACFPKCCPPGEFLSGKQCVPDDGTPFNPFVVDKSNVQTGTDLLNWTVPYYLVIGQPCNREWIRVNYTELDLWSSGELVLYNDLGNDSTAIIQPIDFCLEYSTIDTEAIICTPPDTREIFKGFYTSGMMISVTGLLLTLLVYLSVDALRDLHGKSLACHVGCLAVAYVLLTSVQISGGFGPDVCTGVAFTIQFFLLSSFLWLHVMCLDALWCVLEATGSSPIPYPRAKKWEYDSIKMQWVTGLNVDEVDEAKEEECKIRDKMVERRVFLLYSIYVWTLSSLPVIAVLGHHLRPTIPATYLDRNMELHCVLSAPVDEKTEKSLLYFYPFTAIFISFNIIIFICILIKAVGFKWNMTGPHRVPKQKARMVFLLFVLMSSNWVIDLISWALKGKQIVWVMLHAFYILQGLITFLIFVLEDRVKDRIIHKLWPRIRRINKKYGCCKQTKNDEETALRTNCTPK